MSLEKTEIGQRLRALDIENVTMFSGSSLRHQVLRRVLGKDVNIEHQKGGGGVELNWDPQYLALCKLFNIVPNHVGYQVLTAVSKPEARNDDQQLLKSRDGLIISVDTIIQTEQSKPIEKPQSEAESLMQLKRLLNGQPYLISTIVGAIGTGIFANCMRFSIYNLPVARLIEQRCVDGHMKQIMGMSKGGFYYVCSFVTSYT